MVLACSDRGTSGCQKHRIITVVKFGQISVIPENMLPRPMICLDYRAQEGLGPGVEARGWEEGLGPGVGARGWGGWVWEECRLKVCLGLGRGGVWGLGWWWFVSEMLRSNRERVRGDMVK